ncbi:hypothetical protein HD554DRAFT_1531257 [Boletus coccyginus]|nr:hypothetical protein HD554DRAFT_1531257 [Boletus coccyginus]
MPRHITWQCPPLAHLFRTPSSLLMHGEWLVSSAAKKPSRPWLSFHFSRVGADSDGTTPREVWRSRGTLVALHVPNSGKGYSLTQPVGCSPSPICGLKNKVLIQRHSPRYWPPVSLPKDDSVIPNRSRYFHPLSPDFGISSWPEMAAAYSKFVEFGDLSATVRHRPPHHYSRSASQGLNGVLLLLRLRNACRCTRLTHHHTPLQLVQLPSCHLSRHPCLPHHLTHDSPAYPIHSPLSHFRAITRHRSSWTCCRRSTSSTRRTPLLPPALQTQSPRFGVAFKVLLVTAVLDLLVDLNMLSGMPSSRTSHGISLPWSTSSFPAPLPMPEMSDTTAAVSMSRVTSRDTYHGLSTHMLAVCCCHVPAATKRRVTLFPIRCIILAAHCNLPIPLPSNLIRPDTIGSTVSVPVVPLCIPTPDVLPQLSTFLYTKRFDHLIAPHLLYRGDPTSESVLALSHQFSQKARNACALGIDDEKFCCGSQCAIP